MKKIIIIICALILASCSSLQLIQMDNNEINQIYFVIDDYEFEINQEKMELVIEILSQDTINKEKVVEKLPRFRIELQSDSSKEKEYLEKDGSILKKEENKYYRYTLKENKMQDLFKETLGENIFYGEVVLSEEWIENIEENDIMFNFDENEVKDVVLFTHGEAAVLKKNKVSQFVNDSLYGVTPSIHLLFNDIHYWIQFQGMENTSFISFPTKIDFSGYPLEFLTYELKSDDLYDLFEEIMGDGSLGYEEEYRYDPNFEWIEKEMDAENSELTLSDLDSYLWCTYGE